MVTPICVLSAEETGKFEFYGVWPTCKHHKHITRKDAATLIDADTHRYVGGADTAIATPVSMITECNNNHYVWRNRSSGGPLGVVTKQFVSMRGR